MNNGCCPIHAKITATQLQAEITAHHDALVLTHPECEKEVVELSLIVGLGSTVVDVFVWHKVYGKMEAKLNIFLDLHVKQFIEGVRTGKSSELMNITGGYHYHTIRADSKEILDRIENVLKERGYIAPG